MKQTIASRAPTISGTRAPTLCVSRPASGLTRSIANRRRHEEQSRTSDGGAEAVAHVRGRLDELRIRMNDPYIPKPSSVAAVLVVQTPRRRHHLHIDERLGGVRLDSNPDHKQHPTPSTIKPMNLGELQPQLGPSLTPMSSATSQDVSKPSSKPVHPPGALYGRLRDEQVRGHERDQDRRQGQPEQPVIGEVRLDRTGEHDARSAAYAEQPRR